jgi:hypothetical protein
MPARFAAYQQWERTTLSTTFGGTVEQIVEVLLAQQKHVLGERGLLFRFGHLLSPEMRNPPDA